MRGCENCAVRLVCSDDDCRTSDEKPAWVGGEPVTEISFSESDWLPNSVYNLVKFCPACGRKLLADEANADWLTDCLDAIGDIIQHIVICTGKS